MKALLNILLLPTCVVALLLFVSPYNVYAQREAGVKTVVIDPGHGGKDPGVVHGTTYEKTINLAVALELRDMIRKNLPDVRVVLTRETDVFIPVHARGERANKEGADLFMSIHVNSLDSKNVPSGAITFVMGMDKTGANLDVAMKENDVITYEDDYSTKYQGYVPGSAESFIIFSLMQYVNLDQSLSYADIVQKHIKASTQIPDKGVRQAGFLVLWNTAMPSVLVEMGFMPNAHDRGVLASKNGQKQMATALFNAFSEYKAMVEGRSRPLQLETYTDTSGTVQTQEQKEQAQPEPAVEQEPLTRRQARQEARRQKEAPEQTPQSDPRLFPARNENTTPATPSQNDNIRYEPTTLPQAGSHNVVYRVQIKSSTKRIAQNSSEFKAYRGQTHERNDGTRYRYYVGECRTYAAAIETLAKVRETFPDAFLVSFNGDIQIPVPDARKITER